MICETQGRYLIQTSPGDIDEMLSIAKKQRAKAEVIGEITDDSQQIFEYDGKTVAIIPNSPSKEDLEKIKRGD